MRRIGFAWIVTAGFVVGYGQLAGAADLPVKAAAYKAPVPVAVYDWTGFYVGAHGGWARTDKRWSLPGTGEVANYNANGPIGGVQAGYNWQSGNWVLGAEAQASWGKINKGVTWIDPMTDPWIDPETDPVKGGPVRT